MIDKDKNKRNKISKSDWWGRGFGLAGIFIGLASIYFQFFNYKHDFIANIQNSHCWSDSVTFEIILINNGDYDEFIKKAGFVYRSDNEINERSERSILFNGVEISKGKKKIFNLEYLYFNESNIWQLGLHGSKSCIIEVFFYFISIDDRGRDILSETKIGQIKIQNNKQEWKDETPKILDLFNAKK